MVFGIIWGGLGVSGGNGGLSEQAPKSANSYTTTINIVWRSLLRKLIKCKYPVFGFKFHPYTVSSEYKIQNWLRNFSVLKPRFVILHCGEAKLAQSPIFYVGQCLIYVSPDKRGSTFKSRTPSKTFYFSSDVCSSDYSFWYLRLEPCLSETCRNFHS